MAASIFGRGGLTPKATEVIYDLLRSVLSTCGLHAAKLLLHAIRVMKRSDELQRDGELDVFSLTSLRIRLLFQIIALTFL